MRCGAEADIWTRRTDRQASKSLSTSPCWQSEGRLNNHQQTDRQTDRLTGLADGAATTRVSARVRGRETTRSMYAVNRYAKLQEVRPLLLSAHTAHTYIRTYIHLLQILTLYTHTHTPCHAMPAPTDSHTQSANQSITPSPAPAPSRAPVKSRRHFFSPSLCVCVCLCVCFVHIRTYKQRAKQTDRQTAVSDVKKTGGALSRTRT